MRSNPSAPVLAGVRPARAGGGSNVLSGAYRRPRQPGNPEPRRTGRRKVDPNGIAPKSRHERKLAARAYTPTVVLSPHRTVQ